MERGFYCSFLFFVLFHFYMSPPLSYNGSQSWPLMSPHRDNYSGFIWFILACSVRESIIESLILKSSSILLYCMGYGLLYSIVNN